MKKTLKFLSISVALWVFLLGMSSLAFADALMDFEITSAAYENEGLTAVGKFKNTGDKHITEVTKVAVKIFLHNDAGDSKMVADQYFTKLKVDIKPGEEVEYTLYFTGVPEYTDATQWSAEEGDWEYIYYDETPTPAMEETPVIEESPTTEDTIAAAIDAQVAEALSIFEAELRSGADGLLFTDEEIAETIKSMEPLFRAEISAAAAK